MQADVVAGQELGGSVQDVVCRGHVRAGAEERAPTCRAPRAVVAETLLFPDLKLFHRTRFPRMRGREGFPVWRNKCREYNLARREWAPDFGFS